MAELSEINTKEKNSLTVRKAARFSFVILIVRGGIMEILNINNNHLEYQKTAGKWVDPISLWESADLFNFVF